MKLQALDSKSLREVENRFQQLAAALQKSGHSGTIRDDSRLCYKWAVGESTLSLEEIVQEVNRMQALYSETNYASVAAQVVGFVTKDLIFMHGIDALTAQIWAKRHMVPAVKALYV